MENRQKNQKIILPASFYKTHDVAKAARDLIGKVLFTNIGGVTTAGMIVETESYKGPEDRACHAYQNRKTTRTKVMFEEGGIAYVYLCYGMHALFNVVTAKKNVPHAILIRAIEPLLGIEEMQKRRNFFYLSHH